MQKNIITFIVALSVTLAAAATAWAQSAYSNAVMALNPAGYWPLNETAQPPQVLNLTATNSGTLGVAGNGSYGAWYQASGNQWYLTNDIVTEPSPITNGDPALDCQFNAGQYVILPRNTNGVPNSALTIKPPFSLEAWVQVGTTAGRLGGIISEGEVQDLVGGPNTNNPFYGGTGPGVSWAGFAFGQYADFFFFDCFETNAYNNKANEIDSCATSGTPPGALTVGEWVYVVCTYDGTTEFMYTNGVQAATKKVNANVAGLTYVPDPTAPLMVGSGSDVPFDYGVPFTGGLAEVAIYNEILPQSSMIAHYQTAGGTNATFGTNYSAAVLADNPTIYFRLNDKQSVVNAGYPSSTFPVANDYGSLGAVANGVYQPGTTPGVAGPSYAGFGANSKSVSINGWLGAVDVGNSNLPAALNPTGTSPLTVVSWFQTGPADAPGRFQEILGHSDSSYRLALGLSPNVDEHFNPGPGPELDFSSPAQSATNGFAFNDGQWHMIAGVSDGTNDYLYLDGSLALSNNTPTGINIVGTPHDLLLGGDPEYTFANVNANSQSIRNFDGQIAQVSYFTNALTAAQIQSLFNAAEEPPYIWQEPSPASTAINAGQNLTIASGIRGSAPVTYQWYNTNGVAIAGQTNANLVFSPIATNNAGGYYVIASNSSGSVTSSVVNITVFGPPNITQQTPTQIEIFSNTSPTLYVTASGASPLAYQWNVSGTPIAGATNSTYTLAGIQTNATYGCTVTNILGSSSITPIAVTVLPDPTAPYPAQVLANGPIAYYRLDEAPGAITAFDYVGGFNGSYSNVVNGQSGYTSQNSVQSDPNETSTGFGFIPSQNANNDYAGNVPSYLNFAAPTGSNVELTVEAWVQQFLYNGAGDCIVGLGYGNGGEQFVLDTGATGGELRFFGHTASGASFGATSTTVIANDGSWHHLVGVLDEAGGKVTLYMDGKQIASSTVATKSGLQGSSLPLSIGARESGNNNPINYDFQFLGDIDDVAIYNKALTAAQVLVDYNASGVIPVDVQVAPASQTAGQGATVTFISSIQGGTPPLSYQWFDNNNSPIPGAAGGTNTSLSLTNVQQNQSGNYSLTVMNAYGSTNVTAQLTVNGGPATIAVDIQPTNVTAFAGDTVTFSIQASGSEPFYYQWYQDGTGIPGATNSSLSFAALAGTNSYYCSVSNAFSFSEGSGPAISSTATVVGEAISTVNPANFNSHLKIAFPGYNRSETLAYFPVLVRLGTNLTGFSYGGFASPNGSDLRFADSSGTRELAYEIDQWDDSNGVSSVWVQVPQLSSTNFIWAYWGNPNNTTPPAYTTNGSVWEPASFLGLPGYDVVYHLKESGFPYFDSTTNYPSLNGVAPTPVEGIVGNGEQFNGSGDYLDAGDVNLGTNFTESAWVKLSPKSDIQGVWANGGGGFSTPEAVLFINDYQTSDGALLFGTDNNQPETATGLVTTNQWHLVTAAVDRTTGAIQFYVDGTPEPLSPLGQPGVSTDFPTNTDMNLGRFNAGSFPLSGIIDEARIHGGIDDSNWVWADYMTVASNSVFSAYSSVTNAITLPIVLTIQNVNGKIILTWPDGTLQSAGQVTGPYNNVPGATSPYTNTPSGGRQFYRVQAQF